MKYNLQQAAALAGVSVPALYQAVKERRLEATKHGGRWFVSAEALELYQAKRARPDALRAFDLASLAIVQAMVTHTNERKKGGPGLDADRLAALQKAVRALALAVPDQPEPE